MTYTRRNSTDEQQEAYLKTMQLTKICEQLHITLDPIDWQQFGLWAPVKVNSIEIASLLELGKRDSDDILRQVQIKLFAHAALETLHSRTGIKVLMWSPVDLVQPQEFISLWIITLETDERIPIVESIKNGQRVYEYYPFDGDDGQLAKLFGPVNEGEYHLGDIVTVKEREREYTGEIIYIIPPGKMLTNRKYASRGYRTTSETANTNNVVVSRYIVDCNDGFPHIVYQSQVIQ